MRRSFPGHKRVYKIRDSKLLTEPEREALFDRIAGWCVTWAVGHATQEECDELGMSEAQRVAARRAIDGLGLAPDKVLLDGRWDFVGGKRRIVKGDATCLSIAPPRSWPRSPETASCWGVAPEPPGYDFENQQGLRRPQGGPEVWSHRHPSPELGLHGPHTVVGHSQAPPRRPPAIPVQAE